MPFVCASGSSVWRSRQLGLGVLLLLVAVACHGDVEPEAPRPNNLWDLSRSVFWVSPLCLLSINPCSLPLCSPDLGYNHVLHRRSHHWPSLLHPLTSGEDGYGAEHVPLSYVLAPLCYSSADACTVSSLRPRKALSCRRRSGEYRPSFGAYVSCGWLWRRELRDLLLFWRPSRHRKNRGYVMSVSVLSLPFRASKHGVPQMRWLRCDSSPPCLEEPNPPSSQCRWQPRSAMRLCGGPLNGVSPWLPEMCCSTRGGRCHVLANGMFVFLKFLKVLFVTRDVNLELLCSSG